MPALHALSAGDAHAGPGLDGKGCNSRIPVSKAIEICCSAIEFYNERVWITRHFEGGGCHGAENCARTNETCDKGVTRGEIRNTEYNTCGNSGTPRKGRNCPSRSYIYGWKKSRSCSCWRLWLTSSLVLLLLRASTCFATRA